MNEWLNPNLLATVLAAAGIGGGGGGLFYYNQNRRKGDVNISTLIQRQAKEWIKEQDEEIKELKREVNAIRRYMVADAIWHSQVTSEIYRLKGTIPPSPQLPVMEDYVES